MLRRAINRDPDYYGPDAEEFRPERHLDEDGNFKRMHAEMKEDNHGEFVTDS